MPDVLLMHGIKRSLLERERPFNEAGCVSHDFTSFPALVAQASLPVTIL